jgi:hypothetical protein
MYKTKSTVEIAMDNNTNSEVAYPKYVRFIVFIMTCMELKLFEYIRKYFSKNDERTLGVGLVLITLFMSSLKIFDIIPFISFAPVNRDDMFFAVLCIIIVSFILWYFNDAFLEASVYISHLFLVLFFSRLLIFPLTSYCEGTYLFQGVLSYLWWLAFSYFYRYNMLLSCRGKLNYGKFLGCMVIIYFNFAILLVFNLRDYLGIY